MERSRYGWKDVFRSLPEMARDSFRESSWGARAFWSAWSLWVIFSTYAEIVTGGSYFEIITGVALLFMGWALLFTTMVMGAQRKLIADQRDVINHQDALLQALMTHDIAEAEKVLDSMRDLGKDE